MKNSELVAALAGLSTETVETLVGAANNQREADAALASLEPKKARRGRKPKAKEAVKAAKPAAPKKSAGKPATKKAPKRDSDSLLEE
jgi:hypothetical protein